MPSRIDSEATIRAADGTVSTSVEDKTVLLDLDSGIYYSVNRVGGEIWERIQEPTRIRELRTMLIEEYDLSRERTEADLRAFLDSLADEGLVDVTDGDV